MPPFVLTDRPTLTNWKWPTPNPNYLYTSDYIKVDHRSYTKPENKSGLNGIRTHDLCDIDAVLYQLSYQAIWELLKLCAFQQIPHLGADHSIINAGQS